MTLLQVQGLHVWFELPDGGEVHAVQGVSFSLEAGQRLGLVGESGCGKTSAILALMGLLPPTASIAGQVLLDGKEILAGGEEAARPHRWSDLAVVFQGTMNALNPVQTVGDQIAEPLRLHQTATNKTARRARTRELLDLVGLPAASAEWYPHQLSGGMRQRACLAMALSCRPRVLLADEPTTALDVMVQAQILELIVDLTSEAGMALILVTHDLSVVAQVCQRVAVLYAGEIIETGPTQVLNNHARHPYTRQLFAATPDLEDEKAPDAIPGTPPRLDRPLAGCPFRPRCNSAFEPCDHDRPRLSLLEDQHLVACHLTHVDPFAAGADRGVPLNSRPPDHGRRNGDLPDAGAPGLGVGRSDQPEPETALLEVKNLAVHYHRRRDLGKALRGKPTEVVRAVDGLSFTVRPGEMLALVGESGCGKTSTALAILRMVDPSSGSIRVEDQDVTSLSPRRIRPLRRHMQMIYQDPYGSLDPHRRVYDTVEEALLVHRTGDSRPERRERVHWALRSAELDPPESYVNRYPDELSGGQRQRVAIAASLVLRPQLLIADEPVSMLDVSVRAGVLALLARLQREHSMAIIMITHDLSTAARYANRILVMYSGRVVEEGPTDEVLRRPQHPYTQALVSVVPRRQHRDGVKPLVLVGEAPDPANLAKGCRFQPRCPIAIHECQATDPRLSRCAVGGASGHQVACILRGFVDDNSVTSYQRRT
jgi:peptide/nickel transport system ATP-binding protein